MHAELVCENLRAGYRGREILHGISARFPAGGLSCILGPNGAGKTTFLRALAGSLPLLSGMLSLDGVELARLAPRQRARHVALVPQLVDNQIPLRVHEAVALARYAHLHGQLSRGRVDDPEVAAALEALELQALADSPCGALSGGEWRRVLIAQGLAQGAKVLLLDEPTAFLDPPARHQILKLLGELAVAHEAVVVAVLHDPLLARVHATHALLMRAGHAVACGEVRTTLIDGALAALYNGSHDWLHAEEVAK